MRTGNAGKSSLVKREFAVEGSFSMGAAAGEESVGKEKVTFPLFFVWFSCVDVVSRRIDLGVGTTGAGVGEVSRATGAAVGSARGATWEDSGTTGTDAMEEAVTAEGSVTAEAASCSCVSAITEEGVGTGNAGTVGTEGLAVALTMAEGLVGCSVETAGAAGASGMEG